jgi:hypothetical protein
MSRENVETFKRAFGDSEFERLREALETSSSFPEAAPKMARVTYCVVFCP